MVMVNYIVFFGWDCIKNCVDKRMNKSSLVLREKERGREFVLGLRFFLEDGAWGPKVQGGAGGRVSIDKTLYATLVYTTRGSEESFLGPCRCVGAR